jgi:hypothetical protein
MFQIKSIPVRLLVMLLMVLSISAAGQAGATMAAPLTQTSDPGQPDFGPNVMIFDPSMATSEISAVDGSPQQVNNGNAALMPCSARHLWQREAAIAVSYYEVAGRIANPRHH